MVGAIGTVHIVVGHDCTFGNRRRGTPEMLREMGAARGFGVGVIDPVRDDAAVYSSTHIRELLKAGKPRAAPISRSISGVPRRRLPKVQSWPTTMCTVPIAPTSP